jgi:uncharacterized membrane protein YqaE (UPF0057 family)
MPPAGCWLLRLLFAADCWLCVAAGCACYMPPAGCWLLRLLFAAGGISGGISLLLAAPDMPPDMPPAGCWLLRLLFAASCWLRLLYAACGVGKRAL